jgi:NADP-dependent 3-hydroxy acid dehydrogenase YdfG
MAEIQSESAKVLSLDVTNEERMQAAVKELLTAEGPI